MKEIVGNLDTNLNIIKENLNVEIQVRDNYIELYGYENNLKIADRLFHNLFYIIEKKIIARKG